MIDRKKRIVRDFRDSRNGMKDTNLSSWMIYFITLYIWITCWDVFQNLFLRTNYKIWNLLNTCCRFRSLYFPSHLWFFYWWEPDYRKCKNSILLLYKNGHGLEGKRQPFFQLSYTDPCDGLMMISYGWLKSFFRTIRIIPLMRSLLFQYIFYDSIMEAPVFRYDISYSSFRTFHCKPTTLFHYDILCDSQCAVRLQPYFLSVFPFLMASR